MTQFLLVQAARQPGAPSFEVTPAARENFLARVSCRTFCGGDPVWVIRPQNGELDLVVDASLAALNEGLPYADTPIAKLLAKMLAMCDGLALFWASYPDELPLAATSKDLHQAVEQQLRDQATHGELYARWERVQSGETTSKGTSRSCE